MLQAWINVEFEETLMDYITEGELEEVISESVKKRQEIKSYLLFFFTLNVPLNQDGKKELSFKYKASCDTTFSKSIQSLNVTLTLNIDTSKSFVFTLGGLNFGSTREGTFYYPQAGNYSISNLVCLPEGISPTPNISFNGSTTSVTIIPTNIVNIKIY